MKDRPLVFSDAPMFARVMHNRDICREVLERILQIEIENVAYPETKHVIEDVSGAKGIRLDVFVKSRDKVFDIEMQIAPEPYLGRRMRYYQGRMDATTLNIGQKYGALAESFIIFICKHDPYEKGLPCYSFELACKESSDVDVKSGMKWIVLNTHAWRDETNASLSKLLRYIDIGHESDDTHSQDSLIDSIDKEVEKANSDKIWRRRAMGFMTLEHSASVREEYAREQGIKEGRAEGRVEGRVEGRMEFASLVKTLMDEGETEELSRILQNPDQCESVYKEHGL